MVERVISFLFGQSDSNQAQPSNRRHSSDGGQRVFDCITEKKWQTCLRSIPEKVDIEKQSKVKHFEFYTTKVSQASKIYPEANTLQ